MNVKRTQSEEGGTSRRATKLKARSYSKKAVNFLLTLVMVISLCFSSGLTALAEGVDDTGADQGAAAQAEESTEATVADEGTDAAVDVTEPETGTEATDAADEATDPVVDETIAAAGTVAGAAGAQASTESSIAPMSEEGEGGIVPQATGVHFTTLELHEGGETGTPSTDLLTSPANVNMKVETNYTLVVNVTKDSPTDECWVAVDVPYWMDVVSAPGDASWNTPGSITHTSLDSVISFSAAAGNSPTYATNAGKVYYHIKDTTPTGSFSMTLKPSLKYFSGDTTNGQAVTPGNFIASCGDMNSGAAGDVAQTVDTTKITKTSGAQTDTYGIGLFGNPGSIVKTDEVGQGIIYLASGKTDVVSGQAVPSSVSTKLTLPDNANNVSATYNGIAMTLGSPVDNGDGTKTWDATLTVANGLQQNINNAIRVYASFSTEGTKPITVSEVKYSIYGDQNGYERVLPGPYNSISNITVKNTLDVELNNAANGAIYDWEAQGIDQNTNLGKWNIAINGSASMSTAPQTLAIEYPSNSIVRTITVPKWANSASTIKINGTTYNIDDVSYKTGGLCHVIRNIDLGLAENQGITSLEYDLGSIPGNSNFGGADNRWVDLFGAGLAYYGSITDNSTVTGTAKIYETGTDPDDPSNTTVKSSDSYRPPTDNLAVLTLGTAASTNVPSNTVVAGGSAHISWTQQEQTMIAGTGPVVTSDYLGDPVYYLYLPDGLNYANATIGGVSVVGTQVTGGSIPSGTSVYKFVIPAGLGTLDWDTEMNLDYDSFQFDLLTQKSSGAITYNLEDLIRVGCDNYPVTFLGTLDVAGGTTATDVYNLNDGRVLAKPSGGFLSVQPNKEVIINNTMKVTANGNPLNTPLTYDAADPNGTRAFVSNGFAADYTVEIKNQTGAEASDVEVFIPVPKANQNYGAAFNPDGAQEFDLTFTQSNSLPTGWTLQYLDMNDGVTYAEGTVPAASDYTVVGSAAQADMIRIVGPGSGFNDGDSVIAEFAVTGNVANFLGAYDVWNCVPHYVVDSAPFTPKGSPEALEAATGVINGTVYEDLNGNGVMDGAEAGVGGVTVTAVDNFGTPRTLTTTTAADGTYSFDYVRNTAAAGLRNANIAIDVTVTNPSTTNYAFSPTTTTGNKPSVVTAASGGATADKSGIELKTGQTTQAVDAGLAPKYTVTYKTDGNGTINGAKTDVTESVAAGTTPTAVPTTAADTGYTKNGWTADVAVVLSDGTTIAAGSPITDAQAAQIKPNQDVTLTAQFKAYPTVTFDTNGGTPATIAPISVAPDAAISGATGFPAQPTKTDSVFMGWTNSNTSATLTATDKMPATNITLTAKWDTRGVVSPNGSIGANDFEYQTGDDQPDLTADTAKDLANVIASANGLPIDKANIGVDQDELDAINAAKDAGTKGAFLLTFTNPTTNETVTITVTLKGEITPPTPGKDTMSSTAANYGAMDNNGAENPDLTDADVLEMTRVTARDDKGTAYTTPCTVDPADLQALNDAKTAVANGDNSQAGAYTIKVTTPGTPDPANPGQWLSEPITETVTVNLFANGSVLGAASLVANGFNHAVSDGQLSDDDIKNFSGVIAQDKDGNVADPDDIMVDPAEKQAINDAIAAGQTGTFPLTFTWTDPDGILHTTTIQVTLTGASDIKVTKSVDNATPAPGDNLTYTITVANTGTATSGMVWVKDYAPANTTFVSCDADGTYGATTDGKEYVNWYPTGIVAGDSVTFTMTVRVNQCQDGTGITNVAIWEEGGTIDPTLDPQGGTSTAAKSVVTSGRTVKTSSLAKTGDEAPNTMVLFAGVLFAGAACAFAARRRKNEID